MKKYVVYGEVVVSVSITVEAENEEEALEKVTGADFSVTEYSNETVGVELPWDCDETFDDAELTCCCDIDWGFAEEY